MNKYLSIIFLLYLLSCTPSPPTEPAQPQETTTTITTNTPVSADMVAVTFINNSSYAVNVFVNAHRDIGGEVLTNVEAGKSMIVNMYPSQTSSGDAFYFEYILPIGDVEFPYFSYERSKVSVIAAQSNNNVIIDELTSCETESSYLVLENISSSPMHLLLSSSVLTPETRQSDWIECNGVGVFRMGSRNEPVNIRSTDMLKVSLGTKTLDLQKPKQDYQLGNIYTFAVNNDTPILRTVTPFNIDIQRQIWQVTCENRQKYSDCIVQSRSIRGGTVIFGEAASDKLYSMVLDQYGAKHSECEIPLAGLAENGKEIVYCYVYDGLENSDGTIVLITKIIYADENEPNDTILLCYNPSSKSFRWVYDFAECVGNDEVLVRMNCQNTIIRRSDNVYAVGCALIDSDSGRMSPFFAEFDCNDINAITVRSYKSPNISDTSNDESMFTSVYFD
ncbi:MAG: hypothetical protein II707_08320, partial [Spirochaetales bacterium]|nr:hypothetical protein [Spirochaetales bacterium]